MMNTPPPADTLSNARQRGLDWMEVARAFDALQGEASSVPAGTTPTRWAEKLSGFSANHLRRMSAGRQFYLDLTAAYPALAARLDSPRFSHLEMLGKIWRLDQDRVVQLLEHQPKLSYGRLGEVLEAAQSRSPTARAAGKRLQGQFRDACIAALVKQPDPVLAMGHGIYTLVSPRVHDAPYCKPDMLIRRMSSSGDIAWSGLDVFVTDNPHDEALGRMIVGLATASTFLTQHWLCIPDSFEIADHIQGVAGQLELTNLGILILDDGALTTIRCPAGPPVHDRRPLWQPPRLWRDILEIPGNDESR